LEVRISIVRSLAISIGERAEKSGEIYAGTEARQKRRENFPRKRPERGRSVRKKKKKKEGLISHLCYYSLGEGEKDILKGKKGSKTPFRIK